MLPKKPPIIPPAKIQSISMMAQKISAALAKFLLFRLAEDPKPHTNSYFTFAPHSVQNAESSCKGAEQAGHNPGTGAGAS